MPGGGADLGAGATGMGSGNSGNKIPKTMCSLAIPAIDACFPDLYFITSRKTYSTVTE